MQRFAFVVMAMGTVALAAQSARIDPGVHPAIGRATQDARRRTATQSVWDSVYTDSQSVFGDSLYKQTCAKCHGATLAGTDSAVSLSGKDFLLNWDGLTLDQLYDRILTTMPSDNPKSIPRPQVADILAYVLARNQFPAGHKPLTDDVALLKDIKFVKNKP